MRHSVALLLLSSTCACQTGYTSMCGTCPPKPELAAGAFALAKPYRTGTLAWPHENAENLTANIGSQHRTLVISYRKSGHDYVERWAVGP